MQFHRMSGQDFICPPAGKRQGQEDLCRELFRQAAGMEVAGFKAFATQGLPPVCEAAVSFNEQTRQFIFAYEGEDFSDSYLFSFDTKIIGAGSIENLRNDRITGRRMLGLRARTGVRFGFRHMGLAAGRTMGGYSWAKAGARVHDASRGSLSRTMLQRLSEIGHKLPAPVRERAQTLAGLASPQDLMEIARLTHRIENADVWWNGARALENRYADMHEHYLNKGLLPSDRSMTLGQFLLLGTHYDACIDFSDRAQMRCVAQYTGVDIRPV